MKYLFALLCGAGMALQVSAQHPHTFIRLNEIFANNESIQSTEGKLLDYVELYNTAGTDIDLGGASISTADLNSNPTAKRFTFAPGTMIPAQGYVVVSFDPADTNSFGFKGTSGDTVYLYDAFTLPVDVPIQFGIQVPNLTIGRDTPGTGNWVLTTPTLGMANISLPLGDGMLLKINEWYATGNPDFVELYNPDAAPVALAGMSLRDDGNLPHSIPALSFIGGNSWVRFDANDGVNADELPFRLSAGGDSVRLLGPGGAAQIDSVVFGAQEAGKSEGRVPDGSTNIMRLERLTPGSPNFGRVTNAVINELLTHTDPPLQDAIELHNLTAEPLDISGWGITDRLDRPGRYRIPAGTVIAPHGYVAFYQFQFEFRNPAPDGFQWDSAEGGTAYLVQIDANGTPLGYTDQKYGPAENGVSLGRVVASDGNVEFVPLSEPTFGASGAKFPTGNGAPNAAPLIGPVIISELMYHPSTNGGFESLFDEYIELENTTSRTVPLFDLAGNTWRLRNAVNFDFPPGISIPPSGHLLVVNFDPLTNVAQAEAFRAKYGVPAEVQICGPMAGRLANEGETVELYKPDPPEPAFVPYVFVERVQYDEKLPWPANASGTGLSIQRRYGPFFGNDPANWKADLPTGGALNVLPVTITSQPQSQFGFTGSNATFTVSATGDDLQYQWFFKNKPVKGGTNPSLALTGLKKNRNGEYKVRVSNVAGEVMSDPATLGVITAVRILMQPRSPKPVNEGAKKVKVKTRATGTKPIFYQWLKNGEPITGATNSSLVIPGPVPADSGDYSAIVWNALSTNTTDIATVTVNPGQ